MNQRDKDIERTLGAAEQIQFVEPSAALMQRLKSIPEAVRQGYDRVPKKVVWAVAASIAILIVINVLSLSSNTTSEEQLKGEETTESHFSYLKSL